MMFPTHENLHVYDRIIPIDVGLPETTVAGALAGVSFLVLNKKIYPSLLVGRVR